MKHLGIVYRVTSSQSNIKGELLSDLAFFKKLKDAPVYKQLDNGRNNFLDVLKFTFVYK